MRSFDEISSKLREANAEFTKRFPGEPMTRQPVHTVYGGAQIFKADLVKRMSEVALKSLSEYAPDAATLAQCVGLPERGPFAEKVYSRVVAKLKREPVEDFRIDFEDGYGNRPEAEEDGHAESTALEVARGAKEGILPPFIGIRIKQFSEELFPRSSRTLDIFVTTLARALQGRLPSGFVVTIPKVQIAEQVEALVGLLENLEVKCGLPKHALRLEIMIETPQSIFDSEGRVNLPALVEAAKGRCTGAHFGTYDYTALCNITAAHQHMTHMACDFAKHMMQVSLAGRGVMISDGATNVMPVGPHRAATGVPLTSAQLLENRTVVHRAWKVGYDAIRHSLVNAFYQGWDLHPAQLPIRYAALYTFFLEGFEPASGRLKNFVDKAAQATLMGDIFDDAATGQGLLNYFLRGIACGAVTEDEARATGLTLEEIRSRSFLKILNARRSAATKH